LTASLTEFIRTLEPEGLTVSVGGEIGEVGKQNSTVEELRAYMNGYKRKLPQGLKGISKISVQTGTTHGGVPLPDGTVAKVKLDFNTLENLSKIARNDYGLSGAVQHGASTLPDEAFHRFPETGTAEVHLATGFQNMIYDHKNFPPALREKLYGYLREKCAGERKDGQTEEQFIYSTRKKGFGPFKKDMWDLGSDVLTEMGKDLQEKFEFLFTKLNVRDTGELVKKHIKVTELFIPVPDALK
jgi:hypothetical protein